MWGLVTSRSPFLCLSLFRFFFLLFPFCLCGACTLRGITCRTERRGDGGASSFTYVSNLLEVVLHGRHGRRARVVSSESRIPGVVEKTSTSASSVTEELKKGNERRRKRPRNCFPFFFLPDGAPFEGFARRRSCGARVEANGGNSRDDVSSKFRRGWARVAVKVRPGTSSSRHTTEKRNQTKQKKRRAEARAWRRRPCRRAVFSPGFRFDVG